MKFKGLLSVLAGLLITSCGVDDENPSPIVGCAHVEACNYSADVTVDDGSCNFICLSEAEQSRVIEFVERAYNFLNNQDQLTAFEAFDYPNQTFVDQELYVFVIDVMHYYSNQATILSHGADPDLIGYYNAIGLQDIKGNYIIGALYEATDGLEGKGWSWYYWEDPLDQEIKKKFTYAMRLNNLIIGSGTYK